MRIEQLQAFLAVADTGSFQKAARQCGVTQSTVSRQINGLEAELGMPLFYRSNQTRLALAGEQLLPRARRICQEWQTISKELAALQAGEQPELCVAAIHSVCAHYLPPVLNRFCRSYAKVQLRVTALGSDRALKVLNDGLVDLAIVMNNRFLTEKPGLVAEVLYEEPIEVLMAAKHPLAQHEQITWEALGQYPQVVFKDGYGMQRLVQERFERQGMTLRVAMELNTLDAFRGVVRQSSAIALLPRSALLDAQSDPQLAVRLLAIANDSETGNSNHRDPLLARQVAVVTTSDRLQIPPIKHFYDLVKQVIPAQANPTAIASPSSAAKVSVSEVLTSHSH